MNAVLEQLQSTGTGLYAEDYREKSVDGTTDCWKYERTTRIVYTPRAMSRMENENTEMLVVRNSGTKNYSCCTDEIDEELRRRIYYISDIHIEHQLQLSGKTVSEIREAIEKKIEELLSSVRTETGTLLIAGDVADSVEIARIFYSELHRKLLELSSAHYYWQIIAVLGNHELWNVSETKKQTVDEIVSVYKESISARVLENELFIKYKGDEEYVLNEEVILAADESELSEMIRNSSLTVLGGLGFSGRNPMYNAASGFYRDTVTREEDVERSKRFSVIYDKILKCAYDQQVIVLTHTQMQDWSDKEYNSNWIYLSGHTHKNALIRKEDGTTVLADNQVGYRPRKWHFNSVEVKGYYDPFERWDDGIYEISAEQYQEFNWGRGIPMSEFRREGELYVIKREKVYMFFMKRKNLCVLDGGRPRKAEFEIEYYYDNLLHYYETIQARLSPYRNALKAISSEVKKVGGSGNVHGCIVDVDFLNHIFLNPLDGKVVPYYATSTEKRMVFPNIQSMLRLMDKTILSLLMPRNYEKKYIELSNKGKLPALAGTLEMNEFADGGMAKIVYDKRMYTSSRLMCSMHYVFEGNVVRLWRDDLLGAEDMTLPALEENWKGIEDK